MVRDVAAGVAEHTAGEADLELVVRGEYLAGRRLHDGDVVRVLPGTAHWARPGDLVAAAVPGGAVAVGVLAPDADEHGAPVLLSDWDGPGALLCGCGHARLLGLARPVRLVRAGNLHERRARGRAGRALTRPGWPVRRVPLPYLREAREAVRPMRRWLGVVAGLAPLPLPLATGLRGLLA